MLLLVAEGWELLDGVSWELFEDESGLIVCSGRRVRRHDRLGGQRGRGEFFLA